MKVITYYCDRCGARIDGPLIYKIIGHRVEKASGDYLADEGDSLDYCEKCYRIIQQQIESAISNITEEDPEKDDSGELPFVDPVDDQEEELDEDLEAPEETGKKLRKQCDVGKMKALREAGWSLQKIADDMGCTATTVSNWLKKEGIR